MRTAHSFFVPDLQYLIDASGLFSFLQVSPLPVIVTCRDLQMMVTAGFADFRQHAPLSDCHTARITNGGVTAV